MSPRKKIEVYRWQVALSFLTLAGSYVLGLALIQHQRTVARHETQARIHALQEVAIDSCHSRHLLASIDIDALAQGIKEGKKILLSPTGDLPGVRALTLRGIAHSTKLLKRAQAADCHPNTLPAAAKPAAK